MKFKNKFRILFLFEDYVSTLLKLNSYFQEQIIIIFFNYMHFIYVYYQCCIEYT